MDVFMDLSVKNSWYRFYGCFQKTSFNWNCKEFSHEKDATDFTIVYECIDYKNRNSYLGTLDVGS